VYSCFFKDFSIALKLVSRALEVVMLVEFQNGNDERLKGFVWTSLTSIPTQVEHA
jgi:hypothetical protein